MSFVKNPGEDQAQIAVDASAKGLAEGELEAAGGKLGQIVGASEKVVAEVAAAKAVGKGGVAAISEKLLGAIPGAAVKPSGGLISGISGGNLGISGGMVPGELTSPDLPFFEEKAITSFTGGAAVSSFAGGGAVGSAASNAGAMLGQAAEAIAGRLHARNLELHVESGDSLDVREFSVHEQMSSLFEVKLVAVSDNPSIDFDAVVGQDARFELHGPLHDRVWTGLCNHFEQVRVEPTGLSTYELTIVPKLWLLTQRKNYRIFQQISEPDIVLKILEEWGIKPEVRIDRGAYKKRKYRVQYAETDFAFLSRMLEDAGISYAFELVEEETTLVLSDAPHNNPKRLLPLSFHDDTSAAHGLSGEFATKVRMGQRVRPGKVTLRDHDYRREPSYKLLSSASGGQGIEGKLEQYHYSPGAFLFGSDQGESTPAADDKGKMRTDEKEAAVLAQKRLDAKRGTARVCTFETNAHDLAPGVVLSMAGHPHGSLGDSKKLLVVKSMLTGKDQGEWFLRCEARGTELPFRPKIETPRPTVNGVESATVVGPKGEEIHTDEFGRVRVHFHWDRESKMDDNSSCWVHVSQAWGGSGYGGVNLPRIGQEVLVDFLGGDPDRPVIVGRIYTNLQKLPYKLPANKTQSGWRSNSTGGGGGYNEIMFEDAQGRELVNVQAQRDLKETVKHDETTSVWNNSANVVGTQYSMAIGKPQEGSEAGTYPPAAGSTSLTMSNNSISHKTAGAGIVWTGADICIYAANSILLSANGATIRIGGEEQSVSIEGKTEVGVHSPGVVKIDGDSVVEINCTKPKQESVDLAQPSLGEVLLAALTGGAIGAIAGIPGVGIAVGLITMYGAGNDAWHGRSGF